METDQKAIITHRGKIMVYLSATIAPKRPLPLSELAGFPAAMPRLRSSVAKLVCEVRDEGC